MAISTDQFYQSPKARPTSFTTPPAKKFKAKKLLLSKSAEFRGKISNEYSKIHRDDLFGFKRNGAKFNNRLSLHTIVHSDKQLDGQKTQCDIRNYIKENKSNEIPKEELFKESTLSQDSQKPKEALTTVIEKCDLDENFFSDIVPQNIFDNNSEELIHSDPFPLVENSPQKIPHGLNNLGNTCYLNSVVQSLFSFNFFIEELMDTYNLFKEKYTEIDNQIVLKEKLPITVALLDLYEGYKRSYQKFAHSTSISDHLGFFKASIGEKVNHFKSSEQQDAAEFFTFILETLKQEIELNSTLTSSYIRNPIDRYFEFELAFDTICSPCNKSNSVNYEKANTIHLQMTQDRSIQSAFLKYLENESVSSKCSDCSTDFLISKYFLELPKILFFQVVRYSDIGFKDTKNIFAPHVLYLPKKFIKPRSVFSPLSTPYKLSLSKSCDLIRKEKSSLVRRINFEENDVSNDKNSSLSIVEPILEISDTFTEDVSESNSFSPNVSIEPETLSEIVNSFCPSDCEKYQLLSIICHHGSTLSYGHYTSYVYNFNSSKWFSCDDMNVYEVPFSEVEKNSLPTGYCYFYVHSMT